MLLDFVRTGFGICRIKLFIGKVCTVYIVYFRARVCFRVVAKRKMLCGLGLKNLEVLGLLHTWNV